MRTRSLLVSIASIAILAVTVYAADKVNLKGIKCVMNPKGGAKADKSVEFGGGKVFFCCGNCPKAFASKVEDNEALRAKARAQLTATKQAKQAKCPLSGGPTKGTTALKVGAASVVFCCNNCKGAVAKLEGDAQLLKVFGDAPYKKAGFKVGKKD